MSVRVKPFKLRVPLGQTVGTSFETATEMISLHEASLSTFHVRNFKKLIKIVLIKKKRFISPQFVLE